MVDTPFERSRTSLQKWFFAMYLFTTSRHGVPAKELQRQLGVTYKCAWRMGHEIRKYMTDVDGDGQYGGHVELDETLVGGKARYKKKFGEQRRSPTEGKTTVFGIVERNGSLQTYAVPDRKAKTIQPIINKKVTKGSIISTDEYPGYEYLSKAGYKHGTVCHEYEEYVNGIHHTNNLENFWSRLKNSIRGIHIHVSAKHLPKYLGEFEFRYNMRKSPKWMFERLLGAF
jgi:transposase-like protein